MNSEVLRCLPAPVQTRLDALTEVDDCGQLTIRCSQDYFSLDCGITAYELSDYSPGDEPGGRATELKTQESPQDVENTPSLNQEPEEDGEPFGLSNHQLHSGPCAPSAPDDRSPSALPTVQWGPPRQSDSAKRCLQGVSLSTETSPTRPSLPKRAALFSDGGTEEPAGGLAKVAAVSGLQLQATMSRSTPSLMDAPDRTRFWLDLDSVYPDNMSHSCENLQVSPSNLCSSSRSRRNDDFIV